jgi:hypothetical protein
MSDELWISPMKVLYDDEGRPFSTDTRSDNGGHCSPPAVPCGVIHCIIKRAALAGLREVQKIVQKRKTFGRHQVRRDQIVDLLLPEDLGSIAYMSRRRKRPCGRMPRNEAFPHYPIMTEDYNEQLVPVRQVDKSGQQNAFSATLDLIMRRDANNGKWVRIWQDKDNPQPDFAF